MSETRVFSAKRPDGSHGRVHLENPRLRYQAWCGVKTQFRHWTRPGERDEVTCPRCLAAMRADRPRAWKS